MSLEMKEEQGWSHIKCPLKFGVSHTNIIEWKNTGNKLEEHKGKKAALPGPTGQLEEIKDDFLK